MVDEGHMDQQEDEVEQRHMGDMEELRKRQIAEAFAMGATLAYQNELEEVSDVGSVRSYTTRRLTFKPIRENEEDARMQQMLARQYPALRKAMERVQEVEAQLQKLSQPHAELEQALEVEKREHRRTTDKLVKLLNKRRSECASAPVASPIPLEATASGLADPDASILNPPGAPPRAAPSGADYTPPAAPMELPVGNEFAESLQDNLQLLHLNAQQAAEMRTMIQELAPTGISEEAKAACQKLEQGLRIEEQARNACEKGLNRIMQNGQQLNAADLAELRELVSAVQEQQKRAGGRKAQLRWLRAEYRRMRIINWHDAKTKLEALQAEAKANLPDQTLELPCTPVAAAEDESSIAVDWLAPMSPDVAAYHLEWREVGEPEWCSTSASMNITVPRCAKGGLKGMVAYEFRVRARNQQGTWGGWSEASKPVSTSTTLHTMPPRPRAFPVGEGCLEVRWNGPGDRASVVAEDRTSRYELQWKKADSASWEGAESRMVSGGCFVTPCLHQGSIYIFRVRASVVAYAGNTWTHFSPVSAPVRPSATDPTVVNGDDNRSRNLSKSKALMQAQGVPFAEEPSPVQWPKTDLAEAAASSLIIARSSVRRLTAQRDGRTTQMAVDSMSEREIEQEVQSAAGTCHPSVRSEAQAELRAMTEHHSREKETLRGLEERNNGLVRSDRRVSAALQDYVPAARPSPRGSGKGQPYADTLD